MLKLTCYFCGKESKRKKLPKAFKCSKCKSSSYRWEGFTE